jgi:hypothetical protein
VLGKKTVLAKLPNSVTAASVRRRLEGSSNVRPMITKAGSYSAAAMQRPSPNHTRYSATTPDMNVQTISSAAAVIAPACMTNGPRPRSARRPIVGAAAADMSSPDENAPVTADVMTIDGTLNYQACDDKVCFVPQSISLSWTLTLRSLDTERAKKP